MEAHSGRAYFSPPQAPEALQLAAQEMHLGRHWPR